jgi:hypothetical protein
MSGLEESIKEEIPGDHLGDQLGKYFSPGNPKNLFP